MNRKYTQIKLQDAQDLLLFVVQHPEHVSTNVTDSLRELVKKAYATPGSRIVLAYAVTARER